MRGQPRNAVARETTALGRGRVSRPLLALLASALTLSACGGGGSNKAETKATSTTSTTASSTSSSSGAGNSPATAPTTTPGTAPTTATVAKLGTRVDTVQGNVIVYAYENPVSSPGATPRPGNVFADIDAEGCAGADAGPNAGVGPQAFRLQVGQSAYYPVGTSKEPALRATKLAAGQCARGWVTFELPQGAKPQYALFEGSKVAAWQLP